MEEVVNYSTEQIYFHFDLEGGGHDIPISQSIATDQAILDLVQSLNATLFEGKLEISVFISPPEEGSHLKKVIIRVGIGAAGLVIIPMIPDAINGIVAGLGDGRNVEELFRDGAKGMKAVVQEFLKEEDGTLIENGVAIDKFKKSYDAKNRFYQAALANSSVKGIGFDTTESFPIPQRDFITRIIEIKDNSTDTSSIDKYHNLRVIMPVNTEEDNDLSWTVKDSVHTKRFHVYMEDEDFRQSALSNQVLVRSMTARVRYHYTKSSNGKVHINKKEVVMVYNYNETQRFALPSDTIIERAPATAEEIALGVTQRESERDAVGAIQTTIDDMPASAQ